MRWRDALADIDITIVDLSLRFQAVSDSVHPPFSSLKGNDYKVYIIMTFIKTPNFIWKRSYPQCHYKVKPKSWFRSYFSELPNSIHKLKSGKLENNHANSLAKGHKQFEFHMLHVCMY